MEGHVCSMELGIGDDDVPRFRLVIYETLRSLCSRDLMIQARSARKFAREESRLKTNWSESWRSIAILS